MPTRSALPALAAALLPAALGAAPRPTDAAPVAATVRLTRPGSATPGADSLRGAVADSSRVRRFDIPAMPVAAALEEYARQSGVRVVADSAALTRARTQPLVAALPAPVALRRLLDGTGLAARFTAPDAAVVGAATGGATATRGAQTLHAVVVRDAAGQRGYAGTRTRTATRTDTPLRDTPQAVSVVPRALIADQAMQGMADVVRWIPGVQMGQGEGHRDAPTIRGQSTTADFFVDGVRDDAQYLRDLYNVERVEAIKGANAMTFGRGGGGGVINRVTKEAQWAPTRELQVSGGSFDQRRGALDLGQGAGSRVAVRLNGMYERSNGFRQFFGLERWGINPTVAITAGPRTMVRLGHERFQDDRTVDRGIPSFAGRPSAAPTSLYFGNPDSSHSTFAMRTTHATVEHLAASGLAVRNRTQWTTYDKYYQNVFPGAVDAAGANVSLSGYGSGANRDNLFNQTDVTYGATTGTVRHTFLAGAEVGHQRTDNVRRTGYFGATGNVTSVRVPFATPTPTQAISFRPSATDADNRATADVAAGYLQDQLAIGAHWQAIAGLRVDRFAVRLRDNNVTRNASGAWLTRTDVLVSPRVGLVYKPAEPVTIYASQTVSYLPSAGDQFAGLTATTRTLAPEGFRNQEIGVKWDAGNAAAGRALSLAAAAYRLDRTNTTAPDPTNVALLVQTGRQRSTGVELTATGTVARWWEVAAGFVAQQAEITSRTTAALAGATVPLVPARTASLWNRWRVSPLVSLGAGVVHQGDMYAAVDNRVTLPGFTRYDAAAFVRLTPALRAQVNVENLLNDAYFPTSHGNDNIMPGAPRTVRLSLVTGF
jgi:catecholate siderophore receptor